MLISSSDHDSNWFRIVSLVRPSCTHFKISFSFKYPSKDDNPSEKLKKFSSIERLKQKKRVYDTGSRFSSRESPSIRVKDVTAIPSAGLCKRLSLGVLLKNDIITEISLAKATEKLSRRFCFPFPLCNWKTEEMRRGESKAETRGKAGALTLWSFVEDY